MTEPATFSEGHVVLRDEPLIEITAPLPEAKLEETLVLNQITYQTALATKVAANRLSNDLRRLAPEALELTEPRAIRVTVSARLEALTPEVRNMHDAVTSRDASPLQTGGRR